MKFKLVRTGGGYFPKHGETGRLEKIIDITDIRELENIAENHNNDPLIISFGDAPEIMIYDDYIE
jgi:hypothetical protein